MTENEIISGNYRITERKDTKISINSNSDGIEKVNTYDALQIKMLTSGSNVFDRMLITHYATQSSYYVIIVHLYLGNEFLKELSFCWYNGLP